MIAKFGKFNFEAAHVFQQLGHTTVFKKRIPDERKHVLVFGPFIFDEKETRCCVEQRGASTGRIGWPEGIILFHCKLAKKTEGSDMLFILAG